MAKNELEKLIKKSKIEILKTFNAAESRDFAGGFLIYNPKGSGNLKLIGGTGKDRHSYEILTLFDRPLLKVRSKKTLFDDESEKEVAAGVSLETVMKKKRFIEDGVCENDLKNMLYRSHGLINSLNPSLYFVIKRDFYPASGDGSYFQSLNNEFRTEPSSSMLYESSSDIDHSLSYLLPTKSEVKDPRVLNEKMLLCGKNAAGLCISLHLGNGVTVLIDGHARAAASAMLGKKISCLCIIPASRYMKKGFNKYTMEFASLSASIPSLPKRYGGEGFFDISDCDKPVKFIEKLLTDKNPAFDETPFGDLNSIKFPAIPSFAEIRKD